MRLWCVWPSANRDIAPITQGVALGYGEDGLRPSAVGGNCVLHGVPETTTGLVTEAFNAGVFLPGLHHLQDRVFDFGEQAF